LIDAGISIVTRELDHVRIEGDSAVVGAGARWQAVLRAAWAQGLMPPVLTDYLGLTVGGTLAVGGVGGASFRYGTQTDQVVELRVVTGRGDVRTCSADQDRELFDACRAGLGRVGVVVEARLRLVAAPPRVRVTRLGYRALEPFLADQLELAESGLFDELRGSVLSVATSPSPRFVIEATQYLTPSAPLEAHLLLQGRYASADVSESDFYTYAGRLQALERHMRVGGSWRAHHPWFDLFVPGSCATELIGDALSELASRRLESSHVMMYPLRSQPCHTPLLPIPADPHAFLFDVLPDERRTEALPVWRAYARDVYARAFARGARMYPIGYPVGTPDLDWAAHHGASHAAVLAAQAAHDPDRIFSREGTSNAHKTLGQHAHARLSKLGRATGVLAHAEQLSEIGQVLSGGWWSDAVGEGPGWASDLTDDGTPFELSVQIESGRPELRLLVEPKPVVGDPVATYRASLAVAAEVRQRYGADVSALEAIADLFAPAGASAPRFSLWFAVHLTPRGPLFKVYVNPEVNGAAGARELTRNALQRLGLPAAWTFLAGQLQASTRIPYLSLDLCPKQRARVKIYLAHPDATGEVVEHVAIGSRNHQPGQMKRWLQALVTTAPTLEERPVLTCHAFQREGGPPDVTLHVPIRSHVADDREALTLAASLCAPEAAMHLERVVKTLVGRSLDAARGLLTYVSLRSTSQGPRLTVYLAPQLHALTPRQSSCCARMGDIRDGIEQAQARYAAHAFFRCMERGGTRAEIREVAGRLAFFIMCFQDMERIACEGSSDPLVAIALREHRREDLGHERWYLADLARLDLTHDVSDVFQPAHAAIRDVSYALVSLLLQARHDVTRVAIVLALEGAGHEFFGRFVPMVQRSEVGPSLVFFGGVHQQAEAAHGVDNWTELFNRPVTEDEADEMSAAVDATFRQMTRVAQDMHDALQRLPVVEPTAAA
jgi:DMATS type aromatic prenyltransferase